MLYVYSVTIATTEATSRQPNLPERAVEKLNFVAFLRRTALNASDKLTGVFVPNFTTNTGNFLKAPRTEGTAVAPAAPVVCLVAAGMYACLSAE